MTQAAKKTSLKKVVEKEQSLWEIFSKGIIKENGIFVMVLGMCPALAVTSTFEGAFGMGVLVMIILTLTNTTVSSIRKLVPTQVRIPAYVMIIATEVTALKMMVDAFAPALAQELGVFIALITVNCVVFGRAEAFASKNTVVKSMLDGFGVAVGFALSLSLIGFTREFFGTGTLVLGRILPLGFEEIILLENLGLSKYAFSVLVSPPGAFLMLGFILAAVMAYTQSREAKKQ